MSVLYTYVHQLNTTNIILTKRITVTKCCVDDNAFLVRFASKTGLHWMNSEYGCVGRYLRGRKHTIFPFLNKGMNLSVGPQYSQIWGLAGSETYSIEVSLLRVLGQLRS
jgi:hypothetical protein